MGACPSPMLVGNARTALAIALEAAGLPPGTGVLIPDLICDVVIHPLLRIGLAPIFYTLSDSLAPNWPELARSAAISKCRALMMVHYFGQPQQIGEFRDFGRRHGVLLIENNAHGHGGSIDGTPLGCFGDVGISSPRKILGIPSGGALYGAPRGNRRFVCTSLRPPATSFGRVVRSALHSAPRLRGRIRGWLDRSRNWSDPRLYREPVGDSYGIDCYSRWRIESADWRAISARRRRAWSAWDSFARLKGLRPVFRTVHEESCPWAMPAHAASMAERNTWLRWGARNGYPLFPWPSLPEEVILAGGDALACWKTLVCFPLDLLPPGYQ